MAMEKAKQLGVEYIETSAKRNYNIDEVFLSLASQAIIERSERYRSGIYTRRHNPLLRCENCNLPFFKPCPKIDGETLKLCPKCFDIIYGKVREIENIFNE